MRHIHPSTTRNLCNVNKLHKSQTHQGHQQITGQYDLCIHCVMTYLSLIVAEADNKIRHGPQNGHQGLDGVTVHNRPVLLEVLRRKTALADNSVKHKQNISHKLHFTYELRTPFYAGMYLKQDRRSMFNITRGVFECLHLGPAKRVMPVNLLWSHILLLFVIGHILQNVIIIIIIMVRYHISL